MTIATFVPPRPPSLKSKKTITYRVKTAGFGDGYVQRAQDGANAKLVAWDLVWNALSIADADMVEAFFDARAGYQAFTYAVPGDVERKYTVSGFSRPQLYAGADSITATLTEVFDP